jgi:RimJ/RimL family protein N-acetyltransferase
MGSPRGAGHPGLDEILPADRVDKDGAPYRVRLFESSDRAALDEFYAAFEPKRAAQGLPPQGEDRIRSWLDGVLADGVHLAAEVDGELVGHGLIMPAERTDTMEWAIFLHRDRRGRGIGTEMNRIAIDVARRHGASRLWLSVEPHNRAAVRSYEKVGFRFLSSAIFSPEAEMELVL